MQYRDPYSDHLTDRLPYPGVKVPDDDDARVALAHGESGIFQLIQIVADPATGEDALINGLSILRDELSCQERKVAAVEGGLVVVIKEGLESTWRVSPYEGAGAKAVEARCIALDILGRLALHKAGRGDIIREGVVPVLYALLDDEKWPQHRKAAALAVRALSDFRDTRRALLAAGVPQKALRARLADPDEAVRLAMAESCANITEAPEGVATMLVDAQTLAHVVRFVRGTTAKSNQGAAAASPLRRRTLVAALQTVWNLSHDEDGNAACIEHDAVAAACDAIDEVLDDRLGWEDVERVGAGALMALALSLDGKKRVHEAAAGVRVLAALAARPDAGIAVNAAQCIRLAARYPPAGPRFVLALLPRTELLASVFGAAALRHLVAPLSEPGTESAELAAAAAERLTRDAEGQDAALQVLDLTEALAEVLCRGTRRGKASAARALSYVCMSERGQIACRKMTAAMVSGRVQGLKRAMVENPSLNRVIVERSSPAK
jgi:hypothetical protein